MSNQARVASNALLIAALAALVLLAMGRPAICACGRIGLWGTIGPDQSQMLLDWYSPSHFIHGLVFYALARLLLARRGNDFRFLVALAIESLWEIIENTPVIIGRYRDATMALGYSGDSVVNSMSDIGMMALGFLFAARLPWWVSLLVAVGLELVTLFVIRDNLTLNVWMLLLPNRAILDWQAGG